MRKLKGFLFVDVMIATVLVGLSIVACMHLIGNGTSANAQVGHITQGMAIANSAMDHVASYPLVDAAGQYESSVTLNDISDFNGHIFAQAVGSDGTTLANASNWSQEIAVKSFALEAPDAIAAASATNGRMVTVKARFGGETVYSISRVFAPTLPKE